MRSLTTLCLVFTLLVPALAQDKKSQPLMKERAGHKTVLTRKTRDDNAWPAVPDARFEVVEYSGPLGAMKGMLAKPDKPAKKNPAILWLTGGFPAGGAGSSIWEAQDPTNDQSAQAFRRAGMMVFYPGLRGSFGNPGHQESFYGEVDDVIAAATWLAKRPDVDPERVYLGGHSTGGTLALLVAAATKVFRGVIAFGPVEDPASYGADALTYDPQNEKERQLRQPLRYARWIGTPTLVIEGMDGNATSAMRLAMGTLMNDNVETHVLEGADHFDLLAPCCELLAPRLVKLAPKKAMAITEEDFEAAVTEAKRQRREVWDIEHVAYLRRRGLDIRKPAKVEFYYWAPAPEELGRLATAAKKAGFAPGEPTKQSNDEGEAYFTLVLTRTVNLLQLETLLAFTAQADAFGVEHEGYYRGWDVKLK